MAIFDGTRTRPGPSAGGDGEPGRAADQDAEARRRRVESELAAGWQQLTRARAAAAAARRRVSVLTDTARALRRGGAALPAAPAGDDARARIERIARYVRENPEANLTLPTLAARAALSAFHFARLFKRHTGLSPRQYVIRTRVEQARRLLREQPGLSLPEVAYRCGFSDQSHFTAAFRRGTGTTPGSYRAAAGG